MSDDWHGAVSIKNMQREHRGEGDAGLVYTNIEGSFTINAWRRLLRSSATKKLLVKFFANDWTTNPARIALLKGKTLFVTNGPSALKVDTSGEKIYFAS